MEYLLQDPNAAQGTFLLHTSARCILMQPKSAGCATLLHKIERLRGHCQRWNVQKGLGSIQSDGRWLGRSQIGLEIRFTLSNSILQKKLCQRASPTVSSKPCSATQECALDAMASPPGVMQAI